MSYDSIANALDDAHTHIRTLDARIANLERERDEAAAWIRVVGEECDARGDRTMILAKLRADQAENRALREALQETAEIAEWVYERLQEQRGLDFPQLIFAVKRARKLLAAPQEPAQEGGR